MRKITLSSEPKLIPVKPDYVTFNHTKEIDFTCNHCKISYHLKYLSTKRSCYCAFCGKEFDKEYIFGQLELLC